MTMQGLTKSSATTFTPMYKSGGGWRYDDSTILYDGPTDSEEGRTINYDGVGTAPTMAGLTKSASVNLAALAKNDV